MIQRAANTFIDAGVGTSLSAQALMLMRGLGFTAVGLSVRATVFRSVYTDLNAYITCEALCLDTPQLLTDEETDNAL